MRKLLSLLGLAFTIATFGFGQSNPLSVVTGSARINTALATPAVCNPNDTDVSKLVVYLINQSPSTNNGLWFCSAANTWTQVGTGGGGGGGVANPSGKVYQVGTGYTFTTVDALTETLAGGNYTIYDTNCTGTHGAGDEWTVDPFNPTSGNNLHLQVIYGPCKFPLVTEVPIAIGQSSSLWLVGDNGLLGSTTPGGVIVAGPSFPGGISGVGPTLGSGAFGSVSVTSGAPCGGHTFASTTVVDIEAEYYQLAPTNGLLISGVNGVTLPGTAQVGLSVPSGSCATYTAPSSGSFPTNAVGMSLFATVTTTNTWAWEGNVAPGGTITFPTAQGVTTGLNPSPDPTGYNTTGAVVYIGKRNENASISGNLQFGATFRGAIDANGLGNSCLINVGGEELSGPSVAVCRNPASQFGFLVEGYNGSVTTPNSMISHVVYDASSCSVGHPCGTYPDGTSGTPITSTQEASIAAIGIDQLQSFRGLDDATATPDSANAPTLYDVLVVGTTAPEASVPSTGTLISRFHGEGPASGSHMLAHVKSCGANLGALHVNGNSKNVVDLDDLSSAACQTAAPNAYAGGTATSQASFASDLSDIVPYASTSAVVDHTTGYTSTAGSFLAHYWVGNASTSWCSTIGNQCGAMTVNQALIAGGTWGSATGVAGTFVGDSHGSTVVDFQTHSGGVHSGVWVDGSGNLNTAGNNFTLGVSSQATASFLKLFGSASGTNTNPGYIFFSSNDGTEGTGLAGPGLTTAGTLCTSSGVPTGDCTVTATSKHEIVTFATGTAPTTGHCAQFGAVSNLVEIVDAGGTSCGVASFTGDGTVLSNSGSTGAVTATLATAGARTVLGNNTASTAAPTYTNSPVVVQLVVQNQAAEGNAAYNFGAPSTTQGAARQTGAITYTVTGTATTANFQENYFGPPTFTDGSAGTITDAFNTFMAAPAAAGGSLTITRSHTLGVVDSTSAASSITGGVVVSATLGTTATSVGIGGGNVNAGGTVTGALYASATHCAAAGSGANPSIAACSAAPAGFFSCATNASTGTCQVNTTAVTANSTILVQPDSTLGTALSVTCNTTADTGLTAPRVSARSAASSFTITLGTFSTNPLCFSYSIIN